MGTLRQTISDRTRAARYALAPEMNPFQSTSNATLGATARAVMQEGAELRESTFGLRAGDTVGRKPGGEMSQLAVSRQRQTPLRG